MGMKNKIFAVCPALGLVSIICLLTQALHGEESEVPRLVLAHYMPCFPPVRNVDPSSSDGYQDAFNPAMEKQKANLSAKPIYTVSAKTMDAEHRAFMAEIRIAKKAGLDGFLVDELDDNEGYTKCWLALLKAAEDVGGFKIGLTPDEACLGSSSDKFTPGGRAGGTKMRHQVLHWLQLAQNSPALLRYQGKPVLAPYGVDYYDGPGCGTGPHGSGQGSAEAEHGLADWLASQGIPVAYMADHDLNSPAFTLPYERDPASGFPAFSVGEASFSPGVSRAERDRALAYWPPSQMIMGEVAFVYYNRGWNYSAPRLSSKYRDEWMWNIEHRDRVHWVQIITWNDLGETAIEPTNNHFLSFLTLTRFYADWFKTGKMPAITQDVLYVFHRASPFAAVPTGYPYKVNSSRPTDEVEALAFLTAPATLQIKTGNTVREQQVPAGIQSFITPFELGVQSARIVRGGQVVKEVTTPIPIHDKPIRENLWFVGADSQDAPRALPLDGWTAEMGSWTGDGGSRAGSGLSLVGDAETWEDYSVSATFVPSDDPAGLVVRALPEGNYEFTVVRDPAGLKWQITQNGTTTSTVLDSNILPLDASKPVQLRFSCVGEHLIAFINNQLVSSNVYDYTFPLGRAGVVAAGHPVNFFNFQAMTFDPVMPGADSSATASTSLVDPFQK